MKIFLTRLLIILVIIAMSGCGTPPVTDPTASPKGVESNKPETPKVFKAAMTANPLSIDECSSSTTATRQVSAYVFETLFTFGEEYEIIPQMADGYTVSDDNLVYDITLRKGLKFHDGSTFEAEDVIASFKRFKTTQLYGGKLDAVTSCEATGDYSVRFTLSSAVALPSLMAYPPRFTIIPKEIAEKNMSAELRGKDIIGSGPFSLGEWLPDVHVRLDKFADYVVDTRYDAATGIGGARTSEFDTIMLYPVKEVETRIAGLETGEFDFAEAIPNTSYDRINKNAELAGSIVKPRWSILVEFNNKEWPTNNVDFKKALAYSLNMEDVLKAVTANNATFYRVNPSIYSPEQYYYSVKGSEEVYNKKDLAKVKEHLDKAGYKGEEIIYLVNKDFDWMYKACLSLSEQWQAAGINVKLEFYDWASQVSKAQSMEGWHINQTGWSPRLDPGQFVANLDSKSGSAYGYNSPEMDRLLQEVIIGRPQEERYKIWEQIQALVWTDLPILKVGDYFEYEVINAKYDGFTSFYVIPRFWNLTVK